jgi:short-subunit dehydrogenase
MGLTTHSRVARKWGAVLKLEGVTVAVLHPGWVQTDIGDGIKDWMAKYAPDTPQITTKQASEGVIKVAKKVTLEETTSFYNFDGNTIPW